MGFLGRLLGQQPAPVLVAPVARVEPAPPKMNIRLEPIGRQVTAAETQRQNAFAIPKPPPGVIPSDGVAMDDAFSGMCDYASGGYNYGGGTYGAGAYGVGLGFPGYPYLAELSQRPEFRRPVEVIAKEMTRKWIKLEAGGEDDLSEKLTKLDDALKKFRVRDVFREAAEMDGFFGRGHIYIDTGDADRKNELETKLILDPAKIKQGSLKGFKTIEPLWTYPAAYNSNDPLKANFYKPESWYVQGKKVHGSRLLTLVGREMPDLMKPAYMFGGLSLSQMLEPYVHNWIQTRQSVSDLIHTFSVVGIKTDMADVMQGGGNAQMLLRAQMFNQARDNRGLMMLNNSGAQPEEFFNVSTPLSTLDLLQAQAQEHMAAVCGIPLVKLLGISPAGLNASSEGELRVFFDWVHSQQEHLFRDALARIIQIVQLNEFGEIDPNIGFRFEPLWQLDELQLATLRKTDTDNDVELINAGVISKEESRTRVANDEGSAYAGLDIDDLPELPDPSQEEDPSLLPDPAKSAERPSGEEGAYFSEK
jgi:phage-related protein (TIGR01555 family)